MTSMWCKGSRGLHDTSDPCGRESSSSSRGNWGKETQTGMQKGLRDRGDCCHGGPSGDRPAEGLLGSCHHLLETPAEPLRCTRKMRQVGNGWV